MKRLLSSSFLAVVAALSLLSGCGGKSPANPGTPVPTPAPTPVPNAVRTVLVPSFGFVLNADVASFTNVDFPPVGMLDVTIDWEGQNQVNLYAVDSSCPGFAD